MYLHLGQSFVVQYSDILGIFDLDHCSWSHRTRDFLERAEREGRVSVVSDDLPRSFVVCSRVGRPSQVYLCQLSAATLMKRAAEPFGHQDATLILN